MRKVVSIVVAIIMMIQTSYGFTLRFDNGLVRTILTVSEGERVRLGLTNGEGFGYVVNSGDANLEAVGNYLYFNMPGENVDISIAGEVEESTKRTIIYNANGGSFTNGTTNTVTYTLPSGSLTSGGYKVPVKSGYELAGWSTSSGATTPEYRGFKTLTSDTTLYAVWKSDIEDAVQVGDYVKYYPNNNTVNLTELTGFSQNALNTADTTDWRVLSVNTSTGEIELVSANSVGNLTLNKTSNKNAEGNFTSGSEEIMEQNKTNYANAIYILNTISKAYEKEGITNGSRGLGYNGTAVEQIDTDTYPITHEATVGNENFVAGEPYKDNYKSADITAITNNKMLHDSGYVWLASRSWDMNTGSDGRTYSYFIVRHMSASGDIAGNALFHEYSDGSAYSNTFSRGVRPVVSLTSGLNASGEGTKNNPWILNLSN